MGRKVGMDSQVALARRCRSWEEACFAEDVFADGMIEISQSVGSAA